MTECPLCNSSLDATEKRFRPCPCGYRVCAFCYLEALKKGGLCSACNRPYTDVTTKFVFLSPKMRGSNV